MFISLYLQEFFLKSASFQIQISIKSRIECILFIFCLFFIFCFILSISVIFICFVLLLFVRVLWIASTGLFLMWCVARVTKKVSRVFKVSGASLVYTIYNFYFQLVVKHAMQGHLFKLVLRTKMIQNLKGEIGGNCYSMLKEL